MQNSNENGREWKGMQTGLREVTEKEGEGEKMRGAGDSILQLPASCFSPDILMKCHEAARACSCVRSIVCACRYTKTTLSEEIENKQPEKVY